MVALPNILERTEPHAHCVQFYKADEPVLNRNVGQFLWEGLLRGDGLLVFANRRRREGLATQLERLGADVPLAVDEQQLVLLDAEEILDRIVRHGRPDWTAFQNVVHGAMASLRTRDPQATVRVYGELVGVLWEAGDRESAILLEEYWNKLLHASGILLFCGYPIDIFTGEFGGTGVQDILGVHNHLMPSGTSTDLDHALQHAISEFLGLEAGDMRLSMDQGTPFSCCAIPRAESTILWLRKNLPKTADSILARARNRYDSLHTSG